MTRTIATIAFLACFANAAADDLVLVENDRSPYRIVIAVDATMQENYAANDLGLQW